MSLLSSTYDIISELNDYNNKQLTLSHVKLVRYSMLASDVN